MSSDIFGNLMDWGQAMDKLNQLKQSKKLNEHQPGLARILRYRDNWRLRETVLSYVKDIAHPSDDLLTEVLNIVMDENVYYDARIIAVDALASLMNNYKYNKESDRIKKQRRFLYLRTLRFSMRLSGDPIKTSPTDRVKQRIKPLMPTESIY